MAVCVCQCPSSFGDLFGGAIHGTCCCPIVLFKDSGVVFHERHFILHWDVVIVAVLPILDLSNVVERFWRTFVRFSFVSMVRDRQHFLCIFNLGLVVFCTMTFSDKSCWCHVLSVSV